MFDYKKLLLPFVTLGFMLFVSTPANATSHELCGIIVQGEDGKFYNASAPNFSLLERTKAEGPFVIESDENIVGFACFRPSIVPSKNDYKVVEAGYHLSIGVTEGSGPTFISIEIIEGKYEFKVMQGTLSKKEVKKINKRLDEFQDKTRENTEE